MITDHVAEESSALQQDVTTLARGATVSFGAKYIGRALHAATQIVLARVLGTELYGLYSLGWAVFRVGAVFAVMGLDRAVIRFGSKDWRTNPASFRAILAKTFGLALGIGTVITLLVFASAPWLEALFDKPGVASVLRIFSLIFPIFAGMKVLVAATTIPKRMKYAAYAEDIGQTGTNLLLVSLLFLAGAGLLGATWAAFASFSVAFLLAAYYVWRLFPIAGKLRKQTAVTARQLLAFSTPSALATTFTMLTVWINPLLIGYFLPASSLGIYQALSQTTLLFVVTLRSIDAIFMPIIAGLYNQGEMARLNELYKVSTKWGLYLSLPIYLLLCFAARPLLVALFGEPYGVGAIPLIILATGQMVNVATGAVANLLVMTGHQRQFMSISLLALLSNVALSLLLTPLLGLVGAVLASATAITLLYVGGLIRMYFTLRLWPYDRRYLKGLVATAATIVSLFALRLLPLNSAFVELILTAIVSIGVFFGMLLLQGLDQEDRQFIALFQSRLRRTPRGV